MREYLNKIISTNFFYQNCIQFINIFFLLEEILSQSLMMKILNLKDKIKK